MYIGSFAGMIMTRLQLFHLLIFLALNTECFLRGLATSGEGKRTGVSSSRNGQKL